MSFIPEFCLTTTLSVGFIFLLSYLWYRRWQERRRYPDGPFALPIIGNLHQVILAGGIPNFMKEYRKIYGNVYTVELAGTYRVVVSSANLLNDLLIKKGNITSERTTDLFAHVEIFYEEHKKNPGILFARDPDWRVIKSFIITALKAQGFGNQSTETQILAQIQNFKESVVEKHAGQSFNLESTIGAAVANIIGNIIIGSNRSLDQNHATFGSLERGLRENFLLTLKVMMTSSLPLLKYMPGDLTGLEACTVNNQNLLNITQHLIEEGKQGLDRENPRSLLDHYLIHSEEKLSKDSESIFTESNLRIILLQLFAAGTETTNTTLRWALLYMCKRPDVQQKVREEIDMKIGLDRLPSYADRLEMPYTQAVLSETLRIGNIQPTAMPHMTSKELEVEGKILPAGCELMLNMSSALHDEDVFLNAELFNPDRFMDNPGLSKSKNYIPFGLGRRACIGENMARMELFLFFTSLLQEYVVNLPGGEIVSTRGTAGLTNRPESYRIMFKSRMCMPSTAA